MLFGVFFVCLFVFPSYCDKVHRSIQNEVGQRFQVLVLVTTWTQNIISVLKVFLLVKFDAATIGDVPLNHNLGYNIFTFFFF